MTAVSWPNPTGSNQVSFLTWIYLDAVTMILMLAMVNMDMVITACLLLLLLLLAAAPGGGGGGG